jgi:hypothetical protein
MSATYTLLSPLSPKEMLELVERCQKAVDDYLEDHPECDDEWGEIAPGGSIPAPARVRESYRSLRLPLDPEVLARLARCRSVISIDRPGDIETTGGLQVSILRFLLASAGEGMLLLNDYPFESSEHLLARLRSKRGAKGFGEGEPPKRRPVRQRDAKAGEVRAIRVLSILERAMSDVRVAIDVKATLGRVSEGARNYGALLLEEGVLTDAKAAKALGMKGAELTEAADELDRALSGRTR